MNDNLSVKSYGKTGKVVPVQDIKAQRGSRGTTPLILKLSTRWG